MKKKNDELAQAALAEENLAKLADKEKALADQAAELASKDPVADPSVKNDADKIKQKQDETANELKRLTEENPSLRKALEEARAEKAHDLAECAANSPRKRPRFIQGIGRVREAAEGRTLGGVGPQAARVGRQDE